MKSKDVSLNILNLTKRFKGLVAVNDVSVEVRGDMITGIIGPNGAGKTTLFNLITGFLKPDQGSVIYNDIDITNIKPYKIFQTGVGRTFQVAQCCKDLTVLENIRISSLGDKHAINKDTIYNIAELVGIADMLNLPTGNLSIGNLRKLEIAMVLCRDPNLLLLDEPFSGLNDAESNDLIEVIESLENKTVVIIDHKLKYLMKIVKKVVVLNQGRVLTVGTPDEVVNNEQVQNAYLGTGF